jgi:alginate O-acetyltransferase complex protein AlgI
MLFNSISFLLFASAFFLLFPLVKKINNNNLKWAFIVAASLFFYGWWDWRYIFVIVFTGLIDFFAGLAMLRFPKRKRLLLLVSLSANLLVLFSFKYWTFFFDSLNSVLSLLSSSVFLPTDPPQYFAILPIGISFYTFQSISYTIDVYRNRLAPTKNPLHFLSAICLFPHLVAGPIVRSRDILSQLVQNRKVSELERWNGLKLISLGFFRKVVLADNIGPLVTHAFSNDLSVNSSLYWWLVMVGFAFQIYFDFTGYSDMARGLAKWIGIHFRMNFNHPYYASSFRNFWSRWHISLSTWFRDYVYISMGGSKSSRWRSHLYLWITMLLSGLWHGASLTFLIWGALHAFYISVERITNLPRLMCSFPGGRYVSILLIFVLAVVAWVFFRSSSLPEAFTVLEHMFTVKNSVALESLRLPNSSYTGLLFLGIGIAVEYLHFIRADLQRVLQPQTAYYLEIGKYAAIIAGCIFFRGSPEQFIYFQF